MEAEQRASEAVIDAKLMTSIKHDFGEAKDNAIRWHHHLIEAGMVYQLTVVILERLFSPVVQEQAFRDATVSISL